MASYATIFGGTDAQFQVAGSIPYSDGAGAEYSNTVLALGTENHKLTSDGTIPQYQSFDAWLKAVFGSSVGQIPFRSSSAWTTLAAVAAGQALRTWGTAADLAYDYVGETGVNRHTGTSTLTCYYSSRGYPTAACTGTTPYTNSIMAMPFFQASTQTVVRLGVVCTSYSGAENVRLAIYDTNAGVGTLYPKNLVVDSGTIAIGSAGLSTATVSASLGPWKMYWLCAVVEDPGAGNQYAHWGGSHAVDLAFSLSSGYGYNCLLHTTTYGAYASTFPTNAVGLMPGSCMMVVVRF